MLVQRAIRISPVWLLRQMTVPVSAPTRLAALAVVRWGADVAGGVAGRLDARRKAREVERVLSEAEMEVLVLHCVDGFSVREIGRIVGRSTRAADSLLHRARTKARERLVEVDGQAG